MVGINLAQYWGAIEPWAAAIAVVAPGDQWNLFLAKCILPPDAVRQRQWNDHLRALIDDAKPLSVPHEETLVVMGMVCPCQDAERLSQAVRISPELLERPEIAIAFIGRAVDQMVAKYRTHLERETA